MWAKRSGILRRGRRTLGMEGQGQIWAGAQKIDGAPLEGGKT